jgi:glucokinase
MIIAGMINPSESLLAIYSDAKGDDQPKHFQHFSSQEFTSIDSLIKAFLAKISYSTDDIYSACFGLAGPVMQGKCQLTNLAWSEITVAGLRDSLGIINVDIVNDMVAIGYAIPSLQQEEKLSLNPDGQEKEANGALIGAFGVGLGELLLFWDYDEFRPSPTEGGHASFAPHSQASMSFLCDYVSKSSVIPSPEQVISWQGLVHIHTFIETDGQIKKFENVTSEQASKKAAEIIKMANQGNAKSQKAIDLFLSMYGSEVGDFALKNMATGGVYIVGDVAVTLKDYLLNNKGFISGFTAKEGRFGDEINKQTPIYLITKDKVGLYGAAERARSLMR